MKDLELILKELCKITGVSKVSFIEKAIKDKLDIYMDEQGEFAPRKAVTDEGEVLYVLYDTVMIVDNKSLFAYGCIKKGSLNVCNIPVEKITFTDE